MERRFDLTPYAALPVHRFGDVDAFLAAPAPDGVIEVIVDGRPVHALYEYRGYPTTVVHFSAALPPEGRDTYPIFGGGPLSARHKVNRLSLSDPNYALPTRPTTGWFLGSAMQVLEQPLSRIIRHFTARGVEGKAVLFDSSAGGFAALLYGALMPESVTVCLNPRTDLLRMPSRFPEYVQQTFPHVSLQRISSITATSAAAAYMERPGNTVAYVQNAQDTTYFEGNLLHFLGWNSEDARVYLNLVDSGPSHRMPDPAIVDELLHTLTDAAPDWATALTELGYERAPTVSSALAQRTALIESTV